MGTFLVVSPVFLSHQSGSDAHLITVSVGIVFFSWLVSLLTRTTNEGTMLTFMPHAGVLSVFFSNDLGSHPIGQGTELTIAANYIGSLRH